MIVVWGRNNSTNVKKVLWCLEEMELPYRSVALGGQYGGNQDADYLAMNPNGLIPCLRDDGSDLTLWESNTIVRYLSAQYGQATLWLSDATARAQAEKWMDWTLGLQGEPFRGVYLSLMRTPPERRDPALIERCTQTCDAAFGIVDNGLAQQIWLSGETCGIADIAFGPVAYALLNLEIAWTPRPHLQRWYQQLTARPAFKKIVMIPLS